MKRNLWVLGLLIFIGAAHSQINLASNGTASQSSVYDGYNASLAITGGPTHDFDTKSCSATGTKQNVAWWMLTFSSETVFTSNVIIYYRQDFPYRLLGYSLYMTNNTIQTNAASPPNNGHLCYHHDGNDVPNIVQNVTCDKLGKHVIIYNERKDGVIYPGENDAYVFLELCDVQIIGCYKSWWGGGCRKPCSTYCTDLHCYPTNGTCVWGCSYCLNNECYSDGTCTAGCIKGQGGLFCNAKNVAKTTVSLTSDTPNQEKSLVTDGDKRGTSCVKLSGFDSWLEIDTGQLHVIKKINVVHKDASVLSEFGYSVFITNTSGDRSEAINLTYVNSETYSFPFPVNEHNLLDDMTVGRFVILSKSINSEEICEVEIIGCQSGLYGEWCEKKCSLHCNGPCLLENGICLFGCQDGYKGSMCNEECTPPHFGRDCSETCHCVNPPCHFVNGTCPSGGCKEGWGGHSCSKEISCRTDNISRNVKHLPTKLVHHQNQNVTFYCASGFHGTSVVSTCSKNKQFIPPPPMCMDDTSPTSAGVSIPVFVSVITIITVLFAVAFLILLIFYRKNKAQETGGKYEDLHVYSTCTSNNKAEVNVDVYELG